MKITMKPVILFTLLSLSMSLGCTGPKPAKILMAGDSTMADKPLSKQLVDSLTGESTEEPFLERGWGQLLPEMISNMGRVLNFARNGRSTRTFVEEGLWGELYDQIAPGDVVIIQFGHNDGVITKRSYTNPAQFRLNFVAFVNEVNARGAYPILCTPPSSQVDEKEYYNQLMGSIPIYCSVATQRRCSLSTWKYLPQMVTGCRHGGIKQPQVSPGVSKLYPEGLDDNTHFNEQGARE